MATQQYKYKDKVQMVPVISWHEFSKNNKKKTHNTEAAEIITGSKRSRTTSYYCLRNSKVPVKRKEHQPNRHTQANDHHHTH